MNQRLVPLVFLLLVPVLTADAFSQRRRRPQSNDGARWAHDGKHVVYKGSWYEPTTWKKVDKQAPPPSTRSTMAASVQTLLAAINDARDGQITVRELRPAIQRSTLPRAPVDNPGTKFNQDGTAAAVSFGGELWAWKKGGKAQKLSGDTAGIRHLDLAPSGNGVSFIKANNLFLADPSNGKVHQLTKDGGENTFYGELDWVYQEEVYGRYDFQGAWWSPLGAHLTFLRIDEEGVDTFNVIDHIPDQLGVEQLKYPKAGRTNPRATLHVASTAEGKVTPVDLSKYPAVDEILIVRVGWTPKGDQIVYMVQNREQTWLDLNFADPATGKSRTVIHEECKDGWVERLPMPNWLKDGTFLWESDRTGYRHFYRYDTDGKLVATISQGEWSAGSVIKLDEERGWIGFTGNAPNYSIGRHAYYATLDGKTLRQVTSGRGTHRVSFNFDGSLVLDSFNNLENPGEIWLRKNDGAEVRKIDGRTAREGSKFPKWQQIKARDGQLLDVTYVLPADFDETKTYPVWIDTYSGPAAPSIRDGYQRSGRGNWYILLRVNVRSASAGGMKFTKQCYKQFGVQELADLEDAVDWMCAHPWADADRVGITGWSYGGFMTAFAMTHSKKFKCGIAGGGVYDWGLYDTIYTERYMQTPQHNPAGYRASSVVAAAAQLSGELLIVHGTMDDNVHLQNAVQFVHALQKANKLNFSFMAYPKARHGVRSPHLARLRAQFMKQHL